MGSPPRAAAACTFGCSLTAELWSRCDAWGGLPAAVAGLPVAEGDDVLLSSGTGGRVAGCPASGVLLASVTCGVAPVGAETAALAALTSSRDSFAGASLSAMEGLSEMGLEPGSCDSPGVARRLRTISATSASIVCECVVLPCTPSAGSSSRMTPGFTSNSRASSLILIFDIIVAVIASACFSPLPRSGSAAGRRMKSNALSSLIYEAWTDLLSYQNHLIFRGVRMGIRTVIYCF